MQISPVSFCGKKEILGYAQKAGELNKDEQKLVKTACAFHDLDIDQTSDGDFLENPAKAREVSENYYKALNAVGASKLAYMIAVDTLSAPVIKANVSPLQKWEITQKAFDIALDTPEVTKKDLVRDFSKFGR